MGVELVLAGSDGAADAADAEPRWAKGMQRSARGDVWSMAFQIRGKRHALTLRCGQAEAAVAYDLAGVWSHRAKGNNPVACTRYNFSLAWYPPALLEEVLAVEDWEGLRLHLARLAAGGTLRALVPFEGCGRRFLVTDAEAARLGAAQELRINGRGVHFFRGGWTCIPLAEVESFGCVGSLLQLNYSAAGARPGRSRASVTLRCREAAAAHGELAAAAAAARTAGAPAPRDLGPSIRMPRGGGGREAKRPPVLHAFAGDWGEDSAGHSGQEGLGGAAAAAAGSRRGTPAPADLHWSPGGDDACNPSPEELQLLADFADLARCASTGHSRGASAGSGASNSAAGPPGLPAQPAPAADSMQEGCGGPAPAAPTQTAGAGVKAEVSPAAAPATPGSPRGSSSSSRADGGHAPPAADSSPPAADSGTSAGGGAGGKRAAAGDQQAGHEPERKRLRSGGEGESQSGGAAAPLPASAIQPSRSPAQQQQYTPAQQQYMRMVQMMQMGCMPCGMPAMPQMVPLAAMPAAMAAAYRQQQQQQASGGGKAAPAAAVPFCYAPVQHPGMPGGMAMVPVMAPMMVHPSMAAAAMQAQVAAARHMHAAAAAAPGGQVPRGGVGAACK